MSLRFILARARSSVCAPLLFTAVLAGCASTPISTPAPSPPPHPTEESSPVGALKLPPKKLEPLSPDDGKDSPLEAEDVSLRFPPDALLLDHGPLQIAFSEDHGLAIYARYELTAERLRARFIRRDINPFAPDPLLAARAPRRQTASSPPPVASSSVYNRSGYDRGHLAPAEDMSWDLEAFVASFFMSNMAPQKGDLNRKGWRVLEEQVRGWACGEEKITVVTGPLLGARPPRLKDVVPVPEAFYKIVIDETPPRKIAAFIYEQDTPARTPPIQRQVRVSDIVKRAGRPLFVSPRALRAGLTPLSTWKSATCPERRPQLSAKQLLRERKLRVRLGQDLETK